MSQPSSCLVGQIFRIYLFVSDAATCTLMLCVILNKRKRTAKYWTMYICNEHAGFFTELDCHHRQLGDLISKIKIERATVTLQKYGGLGMMTSNSSSRGRQHLASETAGERRTCRNIWCTAPSSSQERRINRLEQMRSANRQTSP